MLTIDKFQNLTLTSTASINGTLSVPFFIMPPEYHGSVTVTPSAERPVERK